MSSELMVFIFLLFEIVNKDVVHLVFED